MHTEEERRLIVERIDASFTDSIHNDEEQALSLLVERCRLVVYGSLAVIAGSAAAVASMSPPPNSWLVGGAIILLRWGIRGLARIGVCRDPSSPSRRSSIS